MSVSPLLLSKSKEDCDIEEIQEELHEHFNDIEDLITGVAEDNFHLVINGSPGMGKTEFTKDILKQFYEKKVLKKKAVFISGTTSGIKLFSALQKNKDQGQITVIDDTDKILEDTECLDVLKGALDSQGDKELSWEKYSTALKKEDLKDGFIYKGRLIIITNKKIPMIQDDSPTNSRLRVDPVMSRVQYCRAGLPNNEFKVMAIRMFQEGYDKKNSHSFKRYQLRCFQEANVPTTVQDEIMDFVEEHKDRFNELSFRTIYKIVSLWEFRPERWQRLVQTSMFSQY